NKVGYEKSVYDHIAKIGKHVNEINHKQTVNKITDLYGNHSKEDVIKSVKIKYDYERVNIETIIQKRFDNLAKDQRVNIPLINLVMIAHNGAKFDHRILSSYLIRKKYPCILAPQNKINMMKFIIRKNYPEI